MLNEQNQLLCASCGGDYTHCQSVETFDPADENFNRSPGGIHVTIAGGKVVIDKSLTGNPSARRDGVSIKFNCEYCDAITELTIAQHKGNTHIEWSIALIP